MISDQVLGYTMALGCAVGWSLSIILFKKVGHQVHPVVLNLFKNLVGLFLFIPTLLIFEDLAPIANKDLALMCLSGFLGIGIADYFVLRALSHLGASRFAVLECLYSPFIIAMSVFYLGEGLTLYRLVGAALVISAIVFVTKSDPENSNERIVPGVMWGGTGLFIMAVGIVIMKPIFQSVPLITLVTVRLAAGVVGSFMVFFATPNYAKHWQDLRKHSAKTTIISASVLSAYISMIMWVAGFKYSDAMVAAILNQTSTIFTVLLAVVILKEKLTGAKVLGVVLAFIGVIIIAN